MVGKLMRRFCVGMTAFALATGLALASPDKPVIGVVVKVGGIPWFNAMEAGIKKRADQLGVKAFMVGPTSADPALQVRAIEDLIAQHVDVIGVVPNDAQVLEPVLQRARAAGIKVITHESPQQKNADWDFELASAKGFGEAYAKRLAALVGGKGEYAVFVGSLTVPLHNAWADAAIAWLKANAPGMTLVGDRYGVAENVDASRQTALDLMRAHPNLRAILAFGSQGPIGAARAVAEREQKGKVIVLGPFSPGQGRRLVHDGVLTGGYMWNPEQAGEVFVTLGTMVAKGQPIKDGMTIPGLGVVHPSGHNLIVDQLVDLNDKTVDDLAKLGL
ncbi:substrate-binding domain-containing protein [Burkholderia gladioli]|jgi:simple sugar transport system substrate-binding protein|uniref:Substrate-binding domain-containing protein n=2 Tax=Burkholderia gladioli TaxID=28095 RepID=A0AB38U1M3_BURGA|nr:substrate-binding domain-containing protein [Burkholderia gladioli]ASD84296.1 LacI family transcriptional regulator [Burkholderia gladioli pv. gladioli]AWY51720.1 LacI family transcriptional regulator [Burkholderia gladioli pv. gladioli]KAF1058054.1 Autoinducer 2-binding protein LsrB [Burkholderia gladioli]MBU9170702.1 substrate-binding domain-containing protein [Burkholderia gladioli]MBU9277373.1 substrate-binding domain-containing protein [Burkholderia gladioli]